LGSAVDVSDDDRGAASPAVEHDETDATLPAIDFATFVLSLSHSALVHLGDAPDPEGKRSVNLLLARQTVDLLTLLQDKTHGNLTGPEERILGQALYDLRLRYVEVSKPP
jgi:hypothetical protein